MQDMPTQSISYCRLAQIEANAEKVAALPEKERRLALLILNGHPTGKKVKR